MQNLQGIIFDMDGTLVDSGLDFDAMRREMELPPEQPILEAIAQLPHDQQARCHAVLHQHELAGAQRATLLPGVAELYALLNQHNIPVGIVTRNSREISLATLDKLQIRCDVLITRDDGPIKPDPWPVRNICELWSAVPERVVMIGDYKFDVLSGRGAGTRTVLLTGEVAPAEYPNEEQADLLLRSLAEHHLLLAWLESI